MLLIFLALQISKQQILRTGNFFNPQEENAPPTHTVLAKTSEHLQSKDTHYKLLRILSVRPSVSPRTTDFIGKLTLSEPPKKEKKTMMSGVESRIIMQETKLKEQRKMRQLICDYCSFEPDRKLS